MARLRLGLISGFILVSQAGVAVEDECYYGVGRYTTGTILCQSGNRMQCQADSQGQSTWVSLEQQCTDFVDTAILPVGTREPEMEVPSVDARAEAPSPAPEAASDRSPAVVAPDSALAAVPVAGGGPLAIEVLWADYGLDEQKCNARPAVIERCAGKSSCEVNVNAETLCRGLSRSGPKKLLSVYWQCSNGVSMEPRSPAYGQDGDSIKLTCD